jgi:hypothetical protein
VSVTLPQELHPVLRNGVPALLVTCSAAGEPNTTIISQAYWVDDTHVGLSFQFFNKTTRNIRENPRASICVMDLDAFTDYVLQIRFQHSETEGPLFDEMEMQIEAIASATGMSGIFKLRAADVYVVEGLEKITYGS